MERMIPMREVPLALTVAGSETSGGAGMQADLKTFEEYGCHGMVVLTTIVTMLPAQNWLHEVAPIGIELIQKQMATVLAGKPIQAMKTGMLPSTEIIRYVRDTIQQYHFGNIVIDPVMVCKAENSLLNIESADALRDLLVPLATVATPNLFEAGVLAGLGTLHSVDDMKNAARIIHQSGAKNIVVKGGRALGSSEALDVFYDGNEFDILAAPKVENTYNQGAGCSFSAAITAGLANGMDVHSAVVKAKEYVRDAIQHGFAFNQFVGPVYHAAHRLCAGKTLP